VCIYRCRCGFVPTILKKKNTDENLIDCFLREGRSVRPIDKHGSSNMGHFDVMARTVRSSRHGARGCSARLVWTRNEGKSYSRQRAAHRVHKPPPATRSCYPPRLPSSMAAAAVSTAAALTLPRRAEQARGPSLRRRHCAVRPLAAAASSNPARQPTATTSGRYPPPLPANRLSLFLVVISSPCCVR
jgi:hypothetical protein